MHFRSFGFEEHVMFVLENHVDPLSESRFWSTAVKVCASHVGKEDTVSFSRFRPPLALAVLAAAVKLVSTAWEVGSEMFGNLIGTLQICLGALDVR